MLYVCRKIYCRVLLTWVLTFRTPLNIIHHNYPCPATISHYQPLTRTAGDNNTMAAIKQYETNYQSTKIERVIHITKGLGSG